LEQTALGPIDDADGGDGSFQLERVRELCSPQLRTIHAIIGIKVRWGLAAAFQ
jgi:hypothetical protein